VKLKVEGREVFAYTAAHALDPAQPTLVFVHGAGLDHSSFGLQSRYFGYHGRNVLAVDLPDHGRSEGPALPTIGAIADWIVQLLDAAGVAKAGLVGHSMGSLAVLECAARHPERVERIALIAIAYPMKVAEAFLDAAKRNDYAAFDMHTIWGHAPKAPLGRDANPGMWTYGDTLARLERLAPGVLYNDLKACNDYAAGAESAAKLRCPALFVLGGRDVMTPPRAARVFTEAIKSRTVIVDLSGHTLMVEAPDATLDALVEFFRDAATTDQSVR
jgi:pimeloyl-ACP methyl ester carboxylesterase